MKLLTIKNAKEFLESGEIYRIGYNALNQGEFLYEHKDIINYDYSLWNQEKLNQEEIKKDFVLHGKMHFLFWGSEEWIDTENKLSSHHGEPFHKWNGEPLFILDDYESFEDIQDVDMNNIF
tara:strand:- start:219 stop:581 length:363 start_codon:yes stop_codon:yes gene_type:complete